MVETKAKSVGHEAATAAQRVVVSLLELSLGSPAAAEALLAHALAEAGRDALPTTGPEMLAFARAHLVARLTGEVGPRLTLALLEDLVAQLDPMHAEPESGIKSGIKARLTPPPASVPRRIARIDFRPTVTPLDRAMLGVVVVDADKIRRPALARALLRARWSVRVVDTPADLALARDEGEDFAAAVIDLSHREAESILRDLAARYPSAAIIARCADTMRAHALLDGVGIARATLRSADAPPEEMVDALRKTLGLA